MEVSGNGTRASPSFSRLLTGWARAAGAPQAHERSLSREEQEGKVELNGRDVPHASFSLRGNLHRLARKGNSSSYSVLEMCSALSHLTEEHSRQPAPL